MDTNPLQSMVHSYPGIIVATDLEGNIMFANGECCRMFGLDCAEELIGRNITELETPGFDMAEILERARSEGMIEVEKRTCSGDGSGSSVRLMAFLNRGENEEPVGMTMTARIVGECANEQPGINLLRVREVATILKMSRQAVHYMINDGRLPAIKIGGVTRVDMADLRELIEHSKTRKSD